MKNKKSYNDILFRLGYFRNKNNFSARETSLRLGYSDSFINRIERNSVELKVSTILDFMELVNVTPEQFFYNNVESYENDKELLNLINSLSKENKDTLIELAKN